MSGSSAGQGCIDDLDGANGMINMQWRSVVRSRIASLEHELELARRRPHPNSKRPHTTPPDVAAMVKRIQVQKESLKTATATLNSELDRRWSRGPTIHGNPAYMINADNKQLTPTAAAAAETDSATGDTNLRFKTTTKQSTVNSNSAGNPSDDRSSSGFTPVTDGSCGATLYKAWEQIKILEEETDKLREDLRKCREDPTKYQPGCDEDLAFQITRLKEESERRQALIEEETLHIETTLKAATKTLKTCQGSLKLKCSKLCHYTRL